MWLQVARGLLSAAVVCGLLVCRVEAADKKKKAKTPASPASTSPAVQPAPTAPPVESPQDQAMKAWLGKLDGTTWSLELRPSGTQPAGPQQDTLTFGDRRVVSEMLKQDGYGGSNFTLTAQDDQAATWETMQAKSAGDVAFWRADIRGDTMSGILSKQPAQGEPVTYSFTGTKRIPQAAPASAAPAEPAAAPASPSSSATEMR